MAGFRDSPLNLSRTADHSNNINPSQSGQSDWHIDRVWICLFNFSYFPFPLPSLSHYPPYLTQKAPSYHWAERRPLINNLTPHSDCLRERQAMLTLCVCLCVNVTHPVCPLLTLFFLPICDSSLEWKLDILHDTHSNVSIFAVSLSARL